MFNFDITPRCWSPVNSTILQSFENTGITSLLFGHNDIFPRYRWCCRVRNFLCDCVDTGVGFLADELDVTSRDLLPNKRFKPRLLCRCFRQF